jgi:hypothetical protein
VFTIEDVPAGTYFRLAFVDVDGSGGMSSTPGDDVGWYGHSGPSAPNASVPESARSPMTGLWSCRSRIEDGDLETLNIP